MKIATGQSGPEIFVSPFMDVDRSFYQVWVLTHVGFPSKKTTQVHNQGLIPSQTGCSRLFVSLSNLVKRSTQVVRRYKGGCTEFFRLVCPRFRSPTGQVQEDGASLADASGRAVRAKALKRSGGVDLLRALEGSPLPRSHGGPEEGCAGRGLGVFFLVERTTSKAGQMQAGQG